MSKRAWLAAIYAGVVVWTVISVVSIVGLGYFA